MTINIKTKGNIRSFCWAPKHCHSREYSAVIAIAVENIIEVWGIDKSSSSIIMMHAINTNIDINSNISSITWHSIAIPTIIVFRTIGCPLLVTIPIFKNRSTAVTCMNTGGNGLGYFSNGMMTIASTKVLI